MPQYADIGKVPKDLLLGNPKSGAFSFEPKLTWTSTTANGVTFAVTGVRKADKVDGTIKVAYATKKYSADTTVDPSGKVVLNAALSELAKGVKLSASAVLPDPSSAKVSVDYAPCREFSIRGTTTLTSAPVVDVVATAEWKGVLVGGETGYDTAKAAVTKYNVAVGYNAADFQVSGHLVDRASTFKATYAHSVNATTTLGGEVTRKLADGDTSFALGMAKKLSSGALAKLKFDNTGLLSALYETKLASGEKVAGSLQLQSTDLSKAPKYGFAIDLS